MDPNRFKVLWRALCATYKKEPHCFVRGSGKETLYSWVVTVHRTLRCPPLQTTPKELRKALDLACDKGWATKITAPRTPTIFRLKC